jgi:hypothetical protein
MKFKKRPDNRIFEHVQFLTTMPATEMTAAGVCRCAVSTHPHLHTIHAGQFVDLEDGDWIAPEPDGIHYYPIKNDIHEATYESIENSNV